MKIFVFFCFVFFEINFLKTKLTRLYTVHVKETTFFVGGQFQVKSEKCVYTTAQVHNLSLAIIGSAFMIYTILLYRCA